MFRKNIFLALFCVGILTATGCMTTTQKGTATGAGVGAALGAGIGALTGNTGLGALVGAGAGGIGGALVGDHLDKKRKAAEKANLERQLELERQSSSMPTQLSSTSGSGHYEVVQKRRWIEEEPEDGKPKGHWEVYDKKVWVPDK